MSTPSSVIYDSSNNVVSSSDLVNAVHQAGYGTSTQIYTSNGPGVKPTFQASSGAGSLVFIATATASASATVDFASNLSATYDNYFVTIENLLPATTGTIFQMLVGTSGPTYQVTLYEGSSIQNDGAGTVPVSNGTTSMNIMGHAGLDLVVNTASRTSGVAINVFGINLANDKNASWNSSFTSSIAGGNFNSGAAKWKSATVLTSLRFLFNSGNITSGTFKLYGIVN